MQDNSRADFSFPSHEVVLEIPWTSYRPISGLRPEMGTKMAEKWILALPEKWGENGLENEKNGPENGKKRAQNGSKMEFRAIFPIFRAMLHTIFLARSKSIFRPFSNGSIRGPRDSKGCCCCAARPGALALREIRQYQKSTDLLIRKLPFQRCRASKLPVLV